MSPLCPPHLPHEDAYTYDPRDWGGGGKSPEQLKAGLRSAACVWASVCRDDKCIVNGNVHSATNAGECEHVGGAWMSKTECLSRCPVAMGIAGMESIFNAATAADDRYGFGLWQIGGPGATAEQAGFSGKDGCTHTDSTTPGDPNPAAHTIQSN